MPAINELVPNIDITDAAGDIHHLWDYRQKTHLLILLGDQAFAAGVVFDGKKKIMDWLGVRVIVGGAAPDGWTAGAHAIDRYGRVIGSFPITDDLPDVVEKEFLYYDARHC